MNNLEEKTVIVVGAIALVSVGAAFLAKRTAAGIASTAGSIGAAINPVSDKNIFYGAANSVTQAITGDQNATVGTKLWELFNPSAVAAEKAMTNPIPAQTAGITPANGGATGPQYDAMGNYIGNYGNNTGGATGRW